MHAPPLVVIDHASVTLGGQKALANVSFTVRRGETWLVLGANGSGKSTLLRLARGDIWPDDDGRGSRLFFPEPGAGRPSPIGLRHRLGLVSPELQRSVKRLGGHLTAASCILAGPRDALYYQGRPTAKELDKLEAALGRLGIAGLRDAPVAELSNGQLRAVLLARALMAEPLALFLDEFLDGLDTQAERAAGEAVASVAATGAAVVVTSHRPSRLPLVAAQGLVLSAGRVVDAGPAGEVLDRYAAGFPETGQPAPPLPAPVARLASLAPESHTNGPPLVVLERASVFLSRKPVLQAVSLTVRPGEHMALMGANGAGKSSLLKLIAGEYHPAAGGRVSRPGLAAPEGLTDLRDIRKRIGLVSFELEADYDKDITALELVLSGVAASIGLYAEPSAGELAAARRWMEFFGVADLAEKKLGRLSAGQTRRLFLARAMVGEPRLLLLDEPFSGLDPASRRLAMEAASAVARSGVTVLAAVHRPGDIIPEIGRIVRLAKGRLLPEPV